MRILLLNTNPAVSRIVALAASQLSAELEEVAHLSEISRIEYDAVIVDDGAFDEGTAATLDALHAARKVFLSGRAYGDEIEDGFDDVLQKPFLPVQIAALIQSSQTDSTQLRAQENESEDNHLETEENDEFFFFLEDEMQEREESVLDEREVERIKALLEESDDVEEETQYDDDYEAKKVRVITENLQKEGLEIVDEEEIVDTLTEKNDNGNETVKMDAETFIDLITSIKPKKLRKLLKGATVTLSITFKE
jgi:uncharacterized membrane protein